MSLCLGLGGREAKVGRYGRRREVDIDPVGADLQDVHFGESFDPETLALKGGQLLGLPAD